MPARRAFTIIELLVVVSIIALLIGILLPAIAKARDQALQTQSIANLRNLGTAHSTYAAEWNDRQLTFVNDNIASYGNDVSAFDTFYHSNGGTMESHQHPPLVLGWGYLYGQYGSTYVLFAYRTHEGSDEQVGGFAPGNGYLPQPIVFEGFYPRFGSFRLANLQQFHQYVGGKFYDPIFYAPKDHVLIADVRGTSFGGVDCFADPGEYCDRATSEGWGEIPAWSSYVLSPAAMFSPQIMARNRADGTGGWRDPWVEPAGFRSPAMGQALYPALKTHMLEHHWLQSTRTDCNPAFSGNPLFVNGDLISCEPYYFNHSWESSPVTLFYDGHVEGVGERKAERADGRARDQSGGVAGLWSRDTPFGTDGYFIQSGYDAADSSFHILTTDGIRGRDIMAE